MCCEPRRTTHKINSCACGCGSSFRQFVSRKEEQERLEEYEKQLQNELTGVKERIQKIKEE